MDDTARFTLKIWGARGSMPMATAQTALFGGNSICMELRCGDRVLMFDAGSGLPVAGRAMLDDGHRDIDLFFTHCHYDHIVGLPFFRPLFDPERSIRIWSGLADGTTTQAMLADFMRRPFFPVGPDVFTARIETRDFRPGDTLSPAADITIQTALLSHPGGATGYRISYAGRVMALVFDTDHTPGTLDPTVLQLMAGADLCLYDATFTDAEFPSHSTFGHSTWQQGLRLAQAAGAARIGFVHHATFRSDDDLTAMEAEAQALFPGAFFARDFQVVEV